MATVLNFPQLAAVRLLQDSQILRDYPLPKPRRSSKYEENFDRNTLLYDAFRISDYVVRLVCPRLLNLQKPLIDGLRLNGAQIRPSRHKKSLRHEVIELHCKEGDTLSVNIAGQSYPIEVKPQSTDFDGLNVAFTMVKNTPTNWIVDWARYHVSAHGLQGLVLIDNGSTGYDLVQTAERLNQETGLVSVAVISAPFPYGGNAGGRFVAPAKYLQVGIMHVLRGRFFAKAKAVLSVDVDELVAPMANSTIFDEACLAPFGIVRIPGQWVYPSEESDMQPHVNHTSSEPEKLDCNPKWCIKPGGLADRFIWAVHRPAGPLYPFARSRGQFWHFRATTTSWKNKRTSIPDAAKPDAALQAALQAHLA